MSGPIDPYKILGIPHDATFEEVRKAYRRAATKYHPDAGGDAWAFQHVQQAFDLLRAKFEGSSTTTNSSSTASKPTPNTGNSHRQSGNKSTQSSGRSSDTSRSNGEQTAPNRNRQTEPEPSSSGSPQRSNARLKEWLFGAPLELHDETSYFVLANFMDLVMTGILMRYSAVEANPIANYFYHQFGFVGMIGLKIGSVALVVGLAQIIAKRSRTKAQLLLVGGTIFVAGVVVYSMFLARRHILGI